MYNKFMEVMNTKSKLFVIGNGFDLAHKLPTGFNPDFKRITKKYEYENFWEIYQTKKIDIWADFENLLAYPDFNSLESIFVGYEPKYLSDRESDRDSIITQADINGRLKDALYEFANNAENFLNNIKKQVLIERIIDINGYYVSFNYTHTLEKIYGIPEYRVLHIHGEVGKENLKLGYSKGSFNPEKYVYDPRMKGRGPFVEIQIEDYIDTIEDYYIRMAYKNLYNKCKSFYKEANIIELEEFLSINQCSINEIVVYGHSCAIDFDYFSYLNSRFKDVHWQFYIYDEKTMNNVKKIVAKYKICNFSIIML